MGELKYVNGTNAVGSRGGSGGDGVDGADAAAAAAANVAAAAPSSVSSATLAANFIAVFASTVANSAVAKSRSAGSLLTGNAASKDIAIGGRCSAQLEKKSPLKRHIVAKNKNVFAISITRNAQLTRAAKFFMKKQ